FHPGHPYYERRSNYWLLRHCDAVVVISDYERDYLAGRGVDATRIVATGTGLDVDDYRPSDVWRFRTELLAAHGLSEQSRVIVFLGRKLEYKGIATLESWACGTPVITASSGAMPSIVGDGGLVFEYGSPVDLSDKLERLLENAELSASMARHGRDRLLERYTWDKIANAARRAY